jgi:hypothetical protein
MLSVDTSMCSTHCLQIPLHLSRAVALLLPIPSTFHVTVMLLYHLSQLLSTVQSDSAAADSSTPRRHLAMSTQIAASGLLQQLPAALQTAQQQLQKLQPHGWCGTACHYCKENLSDALEMGVSDPGTEAVQTNLLQAYTSLLEFWPGSLGALGSAAVGPTLIPAAQLALSSLQYVCRTAGELHKDSSSSPPLALISLGRSALNTCALLTWNADGFSRQPSAAALAGSSRLQFAGELLSSPQLLSAAVATMNADVYGQYGADSIIAASDPVQHDLSDIDSYSTATVGALFYMQAPGGDPDGNLQEAAWQQLCAREASLQPGQGLLPPLQQQLLDALGCNSKGFLWLAPVWKARQPQPFMPAAVAVCDIIAESMGRRVRSSAAGAGGSAAPFTATDAALRLLLLLPALVLRMELHQQRAYATGGAGQGEYGRNMYHTVKTSHVCLQMLRRWRELQDFVVSTEAGAGAGSSAGTNSAAGRVCAGGLVAADALFVPMLHEVLQFLMHLLLGVMQIPQPGMSSSSSSGCAGTSRAGRQGSTSSSPSSSKGTSSSASKGAGKSASTSTEPLDCTVSPAAAATILSGLIAVLLPAATQAIMGQPASTPASNTAATRSISRSRNRNRNRSLAVTWVPLLLRLTGTLEQAMRFEAQWGPSQPELQASHEFDEFPGLLAGFTQGPAWGATYLLLSQWSHSGYEWLKPLAAPEQTLHGTSSSSDARRPALLQWLLDNTPTRQLPAVQQRVLSVLCTAAKVCLSTEGPIQLTQVTEAYRCIFHTAWSVLGRLLPLRTAPTVSSTAAQTAGVGSSSQGIGVAAPATGQNPAGAASSNADAAMSWLSLLGRYFLQASQQMATNLEQCAAETAPGSDTQQQQQDQVDGRARDSWAMIVAMCRLGVYTLPQCIVRASVLMAAAVDGPANQPLQPPRDLVEHASTAGAGAVTIDYDLGTVTLADKEEQQQLRGAGQQIAAYCSSLGMDLTALHQSARALAGAALEAESYLFAGLQAGAAAAKMGPGAGMFSQYSARTAAASLLGGRAVQAYMQQPAAAGLALSTLPTAAACNNPQCASLTGVSEQEGVSRDRGNTCRCSGCHLAFYCQRSCQKQHWKAHKPVCKAVQASKTASG